MFNLPAGWEYAPLKYLGFYINGRAFKPIEWKIQGLPIIRIQNLNNSEATFNYSDNEHEEKYKVNNGDLLVAWSASLGVYIWNRSDAWLNQHIFRVEVNESIVIKAFLYYGIKEAINDLYKKTHGTGIVHVTKPVFEAHKIPVPPLNEQRRIVVKLEKLLQKVDACTERLDKIPTILKRFRQSVLAAACSGRLTEDWRKATRDTNTAKELIRAIDDARKTKYEETCKAAEEAGKRKPKYFRTNENPIDSKLRPETPLTWYWTRLVNMAEIRGGVTKGRKFNGKQTISLPYLRVANVQDGYLNLSEIKTIEVLPEDKTKYKLEYDDILFTEGGDRDKLGRGTVWKNNINGCIHQNHIFRARRLSENSRGLVKKQCIYE